MRKAAMALAFLALSLTGAHAQGVYPTQGNMCPYVQNHKPVCPPAKHKRPHTVHPQVVTRTIVVQAPAPTPAPVPPAPQPAAPQQPVTIYNNISVVGPSQTITAPTPGYVGPCGLPTCGYPAVAPRPCGQPTCGYNQAPLVAKDLGDGTCVFDRRSPPQYAGQRGYRWPSDGECHSTPPRTW